MAAVRARAGVLDLGELVELWHVYLLALVLGCASAIDAPVRQSFTIEMVGRHCCPTQSRLNSMTFNTRPHYRTGDLRCADHARRYRLGVR